MLISLSFLASVKSEEQRQAQDQAKSKSPFLFPSLQQMPAANADRVITMDQNELALIFEYNNRAVQHLRRGNSSEAVLILLKAVFKLRKVRSESICNSNHGTSPADAGTSATTPTPTTAASFSTETEPCQAVSSISSTNDPDNNMYSSRMDPSSADRSLEVLDAEDSFMAHVPISDWPKTRVTTIDNNNGAVLPENVFMLFDQAFIPASSPESVDGAASPRYQELAYAFILYNLGLALHMKGMEHEKHYQSLHLAVKFYRMALAVLEQHCDDGRPSEIVLLLLALFNNIGHIRSHFADINEALHCVQWLRSLVTAKSPLLMNSHLREEHSFFTLSILIPPGLEFALAPAA